MCAGLAGWGSTRCLLCSTLGNRFESGSLPLELLSHTRTRLGCISPSAALQPARLLRSLLSPCGFCPQHHTRRAVLSLCTSAAQRLPLGHGPDWRSRPIDRVSQYHPSTDRPLPLGRHWPRRSDEASATTGNILGDISSHPTDLCGPTQPFRPERIKPAVSTLATHPPPSTQSLSLPCPALTVPCPVPSCQPALPCQRQRTTASHSDPRVPRVGTAKGVSCPLLSIFFCPDSVSEPTALLPAGLPRSRSRAHGPDLESTGSHPGAPLVQQSERAVLQGVDSARGCYLA